MKSSLLFRNNLIKIIIKRNRSSWSHTGGSWQIKVLTSDSKKLTLSAVVIHYYRIVSVFLNQTLYLIYKSYPREKFL